MRVYLACTIRGDRSRLAVARAIADALTAAGHDVITARFLDDKAEDEDGCLSAEDVFTRDIRWLDSCDLLVAEASGSSYGVGFEVGYLTGRAAESGTRVVILYDASMRERISRMVSGNVHPACTTLAYHDAADAVRQLNAALGS